MMLRDPVIRLALEIRPDLRVHAASTMKVPVSIELGRPVDAGRLRWDDSVPVSNTFASIVDGTPYQLFAGDDGDFPPYHALGQRFRDLGADSMVVLRGVEDGKAYEILSRGIPEEARGHALQADIARLRHPAVLAARGPR